MLVSIFHITTRDNERADARQRSGVMNDGIIASFTKILILFSGSNETFYAKN